MDGGRRKGWGGGGERVGGQTENENFNHTSLTKNRFAGYYRVQTANTDNRTRYPVIRPRVLHLYSTEKFFTM